MSGNLIPREVSGKLPLFTLTGMEKMQVEQHRGITVFQPDRISFRTAIGEVTITGENLRFLSYSAQDATLCGKITGMFHAPGGGFA